VREGELQDHDKKGRSLGVWSLYHALTRIPGRVDQDACLKNGCFPPSEFEVNGIARPVRPGPGDWPASNGPIDGSFGVCKEFAKIEVREPTMIDLRH